MAFVHIKERNLDALLACMKKPEHQYARNEYGDTPLLFAARCGYWDYVFTLLDCRQDIYACNHERQNLLFFLFKDSIDFNHARKIAGLFDRGTFTDRDGRSPVHYAAGQSVADGTKKLLLALTLCPGINARDHAGMTPLDAALRYGKYHQARVLVELGADTSRYAKADLDERLAGINLTGEECALIEAFKRKGPAGK